MTEWSVESSSEKKESIEKRKMKKIFSKLENKNEEKLQSNYVINYTGKTFQINKHNVVVEEVLAEGKEIQLNISDIFCVSSSNLIYKNFLIKKLTF